MERDQFETEYKDSNLSISKTPLLKRIEKKHKINVKEIIKIISLIKESLYTLRNMILIIMRKIQI